MERCVGLWYVAGLIQVILSLVLSVIGGLSVSRLGWGDSGHIVKRDLYSLCAFVRPLISPNIHTQLTPHIIQGYLSVLYVAFLGFSDRYPMRSQGASIGFFCMDLFVGVGLAASSAWAASGVTRPPGPGTQYYPAHTTCGPYQQYIDQLTGSNYTYQEYLKRMDEASGLQSGCQGEMTAYSVGLIYRNPPPLPYLFTFRP
jgi:hypothetical protein